MTRPTSITVNGVRIRIKYVKGLKDKYGHPLWGQCNTGKSTILLDEDQSVGRLEESLFHEIIHHLDDDLKLRLPESTIRRLSCALYGVLKSNTNLRF